MARVMELAPSCLGCLFSHPSQYHANARRNTPEIDLIGNFDFFCMFMDAKKKILNEVCKSHSAHRAHRAPGLATGHTGTPAIQAHLVLGFSLGCWG